MDYVGQGQYHKTTDD